VLILPFKESAVGMASYLQNFAKHYRQIRIFRTGAQKNISNKGAQLGNISIGDDKVRYNFKGRKQVNMYHLHVLFYDCILLLKYCPHLLCGRVQNNLFAYSPGVPSFLKTNSGP
jgi:hypothetical protein